MGNELIHIRVGKGMKDQMQKLISSGYFATEAEIAREGIRGLLIKYLNEVGLRIESQSKLNDKKNK